MTYKPANQRPTSEVKEAVDLSKVDTVKVNSNNVLEIFMMSGTRMNLDNDNKPDSDGDDVLLMMIECICKFSILYIIATSLPSLSL